MSKSKNNLREMKLDQMFMMLDYDQKKLNVYSTYLSIQLRKVIKHITLKMFFVSTNVLLKTK